MMKSICTTCCYLPAHCGITFKHKLISVRVDKFLKLNFSFFFVDLSRCACYRISASKDFRFHSILLNAQQSLVVLKVPLIPNQQTNEHKEATADQ